MDSSPSSWHLSFKAIAIEIQLKFNLKIKSENIPISLTNSPHLKYIYQFFYIFVIMLSSIFLDCNLCFLCLFEI